MVSVEGKQISCDNCSEGDATSYCKQCAIGFCESCLGHHNKLKPLANHQIMLMKDVVITAASRPKEEASMNCTDHNKPLKDHNFDMVSDTFPKHRQDIENMLSIVVNKMLALQDVLIAITTREEDVIKQRDDRIKEIHLQVQGIVELVTQTGEQLEGEVNNAAKGKLQLLGQQKEKVELALTQLKQCKESVEKGLEVGSQQQILSEKKSMIESMEVVSTQINPEVFQPVEEANITFTGNKKLIESCKNIGEVDSFSFAYGCNAEISCPTFSMGGRKITAILSLHTKLGSPYKIPPSLPLTCHLISGDTSQAIICDVKETEVGEYSVSFTPSARGKHQLKIQVGGIDIDVSPFSLHVTPSPEMRGKPVKVVEGSTRPWGVAVDKKEQLIVVEQGNHCITVYDKEGKKVRSFGSEGTKEGQFTNPHGVAVTNDGHILVTDKHRLQKLTPEGHCVMSFGSSETGSGELQFSTPVGIAVHPTTGQIFVADNCNHRIQVIKGNFTYSHTIGGKGAAPGRLNNSYDVAFDGVGNVYVANFANNCVDVFTSDGRHLTRFGSRGSGDGQLNHPSSVTIDKHNMVYVAEYGNHRISVFTTKGVFVRHIDHQENEFNRPTGMAVDKLGNLYVSDYDNNRVIVL